MVYSANADAHPAATRVARALALARLSTVRGRRQLGPAQSRAPQSRQRAGSMGVRPRRRDCGARRSAAQSRAASRRAAAAAAPQRLGAAEKAGTTVSSGMRTPSMMLCSDRLWPTRRAARWRPGTRRTLIGGTSLDRVSAAGRVADGAPPPPSPPAAPRTRPRRHAAKPPASRRARRRAGSGGPPTAASASASPPGVWKRPPTRPQRRGAHAGPRRSHQGRLRNHVAAAATAAAAAVRSGNRCVVGVWRRRHTR